MNFIRHIVEPTQLLLAWQSSNEEYRSRYIVAELNLIESEVNLRYLINTKDFRKAQTKGFEGYPAFQDFNKIHHNVLDAFMRRLPPRIRGDFSQYMEGFMLKPDTKLTDFALLGYSGAIAVFCPLFLNGWIQIESLMLGLKKSMVSPENPLYISMWKCKSPQPMGPMI